MADKSLISFDVTSLFTNIPLSEAIDFGTSSPMVPALANLFMGFHKQNWIEQATNVKPIF